MKVSVVIPCYNEEEVLPLSHKRFSQVMSSTPYDYELIFVNDGSKDRTEELLLGFAQNDPHTKVLSFSRNFGHQNAVSAGLHNCTGDVTVIIDVDLQDPPEVIPQMIETYLREGSNVVYAVRNKRKGETFMKKFTAKLYYRMLNSLSDYTFPVDTGDFRLIDRKVLEAFKQFPKNTNTCGDFSAGWDSSRLHSTTTATSEPPERPSTRCAKCFRSPRPGFSASPKTAQTGHLAGYPVYFHRPGLCHLGIRHVPLGQRVDCPRLVLNHHHHCLPGWCTTVYHRYSRRIHRQHIRRDQEPPRIHHRQKNQFRQPSSILIALRLLDHEHA